VAALNTEVYRKPWATDWLSRAPRDRLSRAPRDLWSTSGPPRLVAPPRTGSVRSGAPFRAGSVRPCGPDAPGHAWPLTVHDSGTASPRHPPSLVTKLAIKERGWATLTSSQRA